VRQSLGRIRITRWQIGLPPQQVCRAVHSWWLQEWSRLNDGDNDNDDNGFDHDTGEASDGLSLRVRCDNTMPGRSGNHLLGPLAAADTIASIVIK
jgi:hypothetical protein